LDATQQDIHATVVLQWHQLVAAHAVRDAAQHNYDAVVASRDNVQARFDAQVAPQLELSRAEAEVLRAQQTIAEADLAIVLAERNLELITGVHPTSSAQTLEDDLHEEPPLDEFMTRSHDAPIVRAARRGRKGQITILAYLLAIAATFVWPYVAVAIYIAVAAMWLIPDKRFESLTD
jgi:outer membrane protein